MKQRGRIDGQENDRGRKWEGTAEKGKEGKEKKEEKGRERQNKNKKIYSYQS